MKQPRPVWFVAAVILLTSTACKMTTEELPAETASLRTAASTYVSQFGAMHSAIPAGAGSHIEDYE
jgi:hypothetical protein